MQSVAPCCTVECEKIERFLWWVSVCLAAMEVSEWAVVARGREELVVKLRRRDGLPPLSPSLLFLKVRKC